MYIDKITQIIWHFAGQFQTAIEQARLKQAYEEITGAHAADDDEHTLPDADVTIQVRYDLIDFSPDVPYAPVPPELFPAPPHDRMPYQPAEIPGPAARDMGQPVPDLPHAQAAGSSPSSDLLEPPQPGSVAIHVNQIIHLNDNDYVSVGDSGVAFAAAPIDPAVLDGMIAQVAAASPIDDLTLQDGNYMELITAAGARLRGAESTNADVDVSVIDVDGAAGIYVNGETVAEAPELKDYADLPGEKDTETETEAPAGPVATGAGQIVPEASVELTAGSNSLINSAMVTNSWNNSAVLAVVGDSTEVNGIIQVNMASDVDSLGATLADWSQNGGPSTQFNVAMFKQADVAADATPSAKVDGDSFPTSWQVTRVEGDLTIVNSVEQYAFVTDQDVAVLSSTGVTTTVGTGGNESLNDVTITELGNYYDLIIVGGSVYDANIIQQYNVQLDNDLVGAADGFETPGTATIDGKPNLNWNQAAIVETGGHAAPQAMPSSYLGTANSLGKGGNHVDAGVLKDFAGLGKLNVLYLSGDMINLNWIKQTNILGDSDQVALVKNKHLKDLDSDWTLSTGANQLINFATIEDVDAFGKSYVGGKVYSDEILVQGNLLEDDPQLAAADPDRLVNEAIVFLDDEPENDRDDDDAIGPTVDAYNGDPMLA